jgi:hypothetical protein
MHGRRAWVLVGAAAVAGLAANAAHAQFGYYQLPTNDFVWNWGTASADKAVGFEDFTVDGGEGGFRCQLKGKISLASQMSTTDLHSLEETLRARLDFIYASSTYMNQLDQQREIEWAKLSCAKPQSAPSTEQEKADREAKAREKMQREVDRRRAHQPQTDSQ